MREAYRRGPTHPDFQYIPKWAMKHLSAQPYIPESQESFAELDEKPKLEECPEGEDCGCSDCEKKLKRGSIGSSVRRLFGESKE